MLVPRVSKVDPAWRYALAGASVSLFDRPLVDVLVFELAGESEGVIIYLCEKKTGEKGCILAGPYDWLTADVGAARENTARGFLVPPDVVEDLKRMIDSGEVDPDGFRKAFAKEVFGEEEKE